MSRKVRDNSKTFKINGKLVSCLTITGFAREVDRTSHTIRRYEKEGVIPDAPIRYNSIRYYPKTLVERVKPIILNFPQYKEPDPEDITRIHLIFKEERERYANQ
jgi:hypothetical protein